MYVVVLTCMLEPHTFFRFPKVGSADCWNNFFVSSSNSVMHKKKKWQIGDKHFLKYLFENIWKWILNNLVIPSNDTYQIIFFFKIYLVSVLFGWCPTRHFYQSRWCSLLVHLKEHSILRKTVIPLASQPQPVWFSFPVKIIVNKYCS